jgi:hypothetical protein
MFLSRVLCPDGRPALALRQGSEAALVQGGDDLVDLCRRTVEGGQPLEDLLLRRGLAEPVDIAGLLAQGRVLCPLPVDRVVLLPTGPGEDDWVTTLPPGMGLGVPATGALEGGAAIVLIVGQDGQPAPLGWLQTQGVSDGARARWLSCGPELCLVLPDGPGLGQARLFFDAAPIAEFPIPGAEGDRTLPDLPRHPAGTVILHRAARWLLRPRRDHMGATVETRIAGLGLPLRNPLGGEPAELRRQA